MIADAHHGDMIILRDHVRRVHIRFCTFALNADTVKVAAAIDHSTRLRCDFGQLRSASTVTLSGAFPGEGVFTDEGLAG